MALYKMSRNSLKTRKILLFGMAIYIAMSIIFFFAAGEQLYYKKQLGSMISPSNPIGEITKDVVIEQEFKFNADILNSVTLFMADYGRENIGQLYIAICDQEYVLRQITVDVSIIENNKAQTFSFEPINQIKNKELTLRIWSNCDPGNAVTILYGNSVNTIKGKVTTNNEGEKLSVNGEVVDGKLCYQIESLTQLWYGDYYWYFVTIIGIIITGYLARLVYFEIHNKTCLGLRAIDAFYRYNYLLRQLIERDFKTKYKRSVLGILWSLLNPLLSMTVLYFVFSNIFKTDTENFVVYLLVGIVFFNFYAEATNMAMSSIVGNSSLITKVYVPKYIYPISRILSSLVNFLISIIPLALVIIATKVKLTMAIILAIYPMICIFIFTIGIGLILSSVMVFFRDTQFIYGVFLTALMYFTPIFYPITIIPERFRWIYYLNPVSNNIVFARSCILDGIFPGMQLFLLCGGVSIASLAIGAYIFIRNQDQFILHI